MIQSKAVTVTAAALAVASLFYTASATPALVYNQSNENKIQEPIYYSEEIPSSSFFADFTANLAPTEDDLALIFVLQRASNGADNLSNLAKEGLLPSMPQQQIYNHVSGVEGPRSVMRELKAANPILLDFDDLEIKLSGNIPEVSGKKQKAKRRKLMDANMVVVDVKNSVPAKELDEGVRKAMQQKNVKSIVVTAARSARETKMEKEMKRNDVKSERQAPRRRLEGQGDDGADNGGDDEVVYYVYMTPNILAGLMFAGLFTSVVFLGISCMGMIQGQDVFVSKMPSVGRES